MKVYYLLLLFFSTLFCCSLHTQSQPTERLPPRGRDPLANGLKSLDRQKVLLNGKRFTVSGNFNYRRNVLPVGEERLLQRTSSYMLPVLFGRKLNRNWCLEAGPFAGLNRYVFQRPGMLKVEVAPRATRMEFTYGLFVGLSRRLTNQLSLQLGYRKDFGSGEQAWQPIHLGWSLTF